ncbi:hypothetical protein Pint_27051 [Pistacia integerrima]|uniref:Uncharacterized protein n=1 Tax=Pistacia integerrima TaxID=434235 RepID=A0ACC0YRD6_9ROSI|nr:hypothetical protein Pint_27051 [Pistacia integerrima]
MPSIPPPEFNWVLGVLSELCEGIYLKVEALTQFILEQLERKGYYKCDVPFTRPSKPVVLFAIPDDRQQTVLNLDENFLSPWEIVALVGLGIFFPSSDQNCVLYTAVIAVYVDTGRTVVTWNTSSWKWIRFMQVARSLQTTQGDVAIINSSTMQGFSFCIYGLKYRGNIDRGQEGKAVCAFHDLLVK